MCILYAPQHKLPFGAADVDAATPECRELESLLWPRTFGIDFPHGTRHILITMYGGIGHGQDFHIRHNPGEQTSANWTALSYFLRALYVNLSILLDEIRVKTFDGAGGDKKALGAEFANLLVEQRLALQTLQIFVHQQYIIVTQLHLEGIITNLEQEFFDFNDQISGQR